MYLQKNKNNLGDDTIPYIGTSTFRFNPGILPITTYPGRHIVFETITNTGLLSYDKLIPVEPVESFEIWKLNISNNTPLFLNIITSNIYLSTYVDMIIKSSPENIKKIISNLDFFIDTVFYSILPELNRIKTSYEQEQRINFVELSLVVVFKGFTGGILDTIKQYAEAGQYEKAIDKIESLQWRYKIAVELWNAITFFVYAQLRTKLAEEQIIKEPEKTNMLVTAGIGALMFLL